MKVLPTFFVLAILTFAVVRGQIQDEPVFSLGTDDVHKAVVLVADVKPRAILLEVTYSKEKQAELLKMTQQGLPKKISFALNGKVLMERTYTQSSTGHSIKFPMPTLDDAFMQARTLILGTAPPPPAPAPVAEVPDQPVFSVMPADVSKPTVFMYKPSRFWVEFALVPEKKAELTALEAKNPGGTIVLSVDGTIAGAIDTHAGASATTVRVPMATIEKAIIVIKALVGKSEKSPQGM